MAGSLSHGNARVNMGWCAPRASYFEGLINASGRKGANFTPLDGEIARSRDDHVSQKSMSSLCYDYGPDTSKINHNVGHAVVRREKCKALGGVGVEN